ncbi:hypothetical protein F4561_000564 [Lipingzhangella halophila]|uniref:Secreted protein n=1 Tax=Lipingzhangella halophila TaxID=1783352 RepID=A0A7W7W1G5_9ACTN|nr:hypothetical protein [Lipingzhangella halophila]MBB4929744.1 hypothetical protein [Lipingzhangella halophila]
MARRRLRLAVVSTSALVPAIARPAAQKSTPPPSMKRSPAAAGPPAIAAQYRTAAQPRSPAVAAASAPSSHRRATGEGDVSAPETPWQYGFSVISMLSGSSGSKSTSTRQPSTGTRPSNPLVNRMVCSRPSGSAKRSQNGWSKRPLSGGTMGSTDATVAPVRTPCSSRRCRRRRSRIPSTVKSTMKNPKMTAINVTMSTAVVGMALPAFGRNCAAG